MMNKNILNEVYERCLINCDLADDVCSELGLKRNELTSLIIQIEKERSEEVKEMRRIRTLYHNKKGANFKFSGFMEFYIWYINQYAEQKGQCYYCKTSEETISTLFLKKYSSSKRSNRGKHLEVERRDSKKNEYSAENCVLACYFCNNDKSDVFSEEEYFEYLKNRKLFLEQQFKDCNDS